MDSRMAQKCGSAVFCFYGINDSGKKDSREVSMKADSRKKLDRLCLAMIDYDRRDPMRIQHLIKVHAFSAMIGRGEGLDEKTQLILEAAAYVNDIGIHRAEILCGKSDGKLQEKYGPAEAKPGLEKIGFEKDEIDRICYLIGDHHTYKDIDGMDYQILVEADFLVNLYEDHSSVAGIQSAYSKIFRTECGKKIFREMYLDAGDPEYEKWLQSKVQAADAE